MKAVKELKPGERERYDLLLVRVKEMQGRNGPFCILTFSPGPAEHPFEARMWKKTREQVLAAAPEMTVVTVSVTADEYNGQITYVADAMAPSQERSVDEFITTGRASGEAMLRFMDGLITKTCMEHAAAMPALALLRNHAQELSVWPGALRVHHAYKGGLAVHMGTCASACSRIAPVLKRENIDSICKKEPGQLRQCICSLLSAKPGRPLSMFAAEALEKINVLSGGVDLREGLKEKAIALVLAERLFKCYPVLDQDLLCAAIAFRGYSLFMGDILCGVIGTPAADVQAVSREAKAHSLGGESVRMLMHCMIVNEANDRKAAIPEAFLVIELEKIARLALENRDMPSPDNACMVLSAAIHDIGKLKELSSDAYGAADYQADGNLFGHVQLGIAMFLDEVEKAGVQTEQVVDVLGCMASHHGRPEWGALAEPATYEAKIVSAIDYIDSRLDIYDGCMKAMEEGERDESPRRYIGNIVYKKMSA